MVSNLGEGESPAYHRSSSSIRSVRSSTTGTSMLAGTIVSDAVLAARARLSREKKRQEEERAVEQAAKEEEEACRALRSQGLAAQVRFQMHSYSVA
jgi:hypothetical protein